MLSYTALCILVVIETIWLLRIYIRKQRWIYSYQKNFPKYQNRPLKPDIPPHPDYLSIVENPTFHVECCRIFNKPEARIFYAARNALQAPGFENWHVHGQVSLGELFRVDEENYIPQGQNDRGAPRSAFNSKRSDMVITDNFGQPRLFIEYQGRGHRYGNDPVKKTLFRKACVDLMEIEPPLTGPEWIDVSAVSKDILSRLQMISQIQNPDHIGV